MSTDGLTTRVVALEPVAKSPSPDADANDRPSSPLRPATARQNEVLERGEGNKNDTKSEEEEWKGEGDESGTPQQPGKPSMPINHTTSAATLLLKLPFDEVVGKIIKHDRIKKEKFPIIQEERRGLLRLWGRGEGRDPPPGYEDYPLTPSETNLEASSPAQFQNNIPAPVQRINAIGADGLPDLTRGTVDRYVWSYHTHLGILHPILTPRHLNGLIKNFLQSMPGHPSRSINTALVLLVLALGEICTHTTKIPDVSELEDQWAAGAAQRYHFPKARNLDILPGLPYFVLATTIIGNQLGGNSIPHVHAFILASLYYAQLGRVLESHTSLCHAYRALQVILRP
jgi:hypothetical protein